MDQKLCLELEGLLAGALEQQNTSVQTERLNEILNNSHEAIDYCVEFYSLVSNLKCSSTLSKFFQNSDTSTSLKNIELLRQIAYIEMSAPAIGIPQQEVENKETIIVTEKPKNERLIVNQLYRISNAIIYAVAVLMFCFIVYTQLNPVRYSESVGKVVGQINTVWKVGTVPLNNNDKVRTNTDLFRLEEGIIKIEFDKGVIALIEGPAKFEFEKESIFLECGRLYCHVPETGLGFTVKTPTSQFVDHGTEFGVQAYANGSSELHVTKGKVQLFAGIEGKTRVGQMVTENNASYYNAYENNISTIGIKKNAFVRDIDVKRKILWRGQDIDLADIVGGGTGFGGGELESGIDVDDGKWKNKELLYRQNVSAGWIRYSDNKYNKVPSIDYIDGVFVPYDADGPVQLSSKGHSYSGFHVGSNEHWNNICFGAWHESSHATKHNLSSEGKTFGLDSDTAAITIHSNQGITFDLDAIRENIPERRINNFTTKVAISESILIYGKEEGIEEKPSKIDFWCFVDGELKEKKEGITYRDGLVEVKITLGDNERYLTLVVTESDDKCSFDWAFLANPVLVVE